MLPELEILLAIQSLDVRLARLDRELAEIPKELAALDARIGNARGLVEEVETGLEECERERRRAEGHLEDAEALVAKYEDQLTRARTNEEYRGLQAQIRATRGRIDGIEDRVLELMDRGEELTRGVAREKAAFRRARGEFESRKGEVRSQARAREASRDRLREQRAERAADLPTSVLTRYERIRTMRGRGLARAVDEICEACRVSLRPQLFEEVRADRGIFACESCSRLLYFEPPAQGDGAAEADRTDQAAGDR